MSRAGNPGIKKYHYQAAGDEPLIAHLQIKIAPSQLAALKRRKDWQNYLRSLLADALAEE
jgi:hypothetical protein